MPPASLPQLALPLDEAPDQPDKWDQKLLAAFADKEMTSGFLPLAQEALRTQPGDPHVLCLAATAALLDRNPERALVFLKRYAKRYVPKATHHLLSALAAEQQNKPVVARAILEQNGLTYRFEALRAFPAGWARLEWLDDRLANIFGKLNRKSAGALAGRTGAKTMPRTAQRAVPKAAPKAAANAATKAVMQPARGAPAQPAVPAALGAATEPAPLPRIEIDIPFTAE